MFPGKKTPEGMFSCEDKELETKEITRHTGAKITM